MKKIILILMMAVIVDQVTKGILLSLVSDEWHFYGDALIIVPYPYMMAKVTSWFNLVFTWNPGTSFSIMQTAPRLLIILITGVIIGYLCRYLFTKVKNNHEKWAMSLIVGGAIGNLIDRIRFGAVIDFIDWHIGTWHWPAFNFADICISIGIGLYILYFITSKGKKNGSILRHKK